MFFSGCGFNNTENKQTENNRTQWFTISNGEITPSTRIDITLGSVAEPAVTGVPWTIAGRIAGFASYRENVCFALNGSGIVFCYQEKNNRIRFETFYSPDFFSGKTITTLLPVNDSLLCHLYFNAILFPFEQKNSFFKSPNLVLVSGEKNNFSVKAMYPPQPETDPFWEITGFLPRDRNKYYLEWKKTGKTSASFRYSYYAPDTKKETDITRDDFLKAYDFTGTDSKGNPEQLSAIFRKIMDDDPHDKKNTAFIFHVRDTADNITRYYRKDADIPLTDKKYELIHILMCKNGKGYYALTEAGTIYFSGTVSKEIRILELPGLASGFRYTDFFVYKDFLYTSWEQSDFLNVSAAGLLVMNMDQLHPATSR